MLVGYLGAQAQLNLDITEFELHLPNPNPATLESILETPVVHTGSTQDTFVFKRTTYEITQGLATSVCVGISCYPPGNSGTWFKLTAGQNTTLSVHLWNYTQIQDPKALVRVRFHRQHFEADSASIWFRFGDVQILGAKEPALAQVSVFPNPTTDFFSLNNVDDVQAIHLFTFEGRKVSRIEANFANQYDISDLAAGKYVLALENTEGQIFGVAELQKL